MREKPKNDESPGYSDSIGLVLSLYCFLIMCVPNQCIRVSLKRIISAPTSFDSAAKLMSSISFHLPLPLRQAEHANFFGLKLHLPS